MFQWKSSQQSKDWDVWDSPSVLEPRSCSEDGGFKVSGYHFSAILMIVLWIWMEFDEMYGIWMDETIEIYGIRILYHLSISNTMKSMEFEWIWMGQLWLVGGFALENQSKIDDLAFPPANRKPPCLNQPLNLRIAAGYPILTVVQDWTSFAKAYLPRGLVNMFLKISFFFKTF